MYNFRKHVLKNVVALPMLAFILCFCSAFSFFGSSDGPKQEKSIPEWFLSPQPNNTVYLYGTGSGFNIEDAKTSALNDAASRLQTQISSTTNSEMSSNTSGGDETFNQSFDQKINANVAKITFNNYKTSKTSENQGKFYVEITIDRDAFVTNQEAELSTIQNALSNAIAGFTSETSNLEKRNALKTLLPNIPEAKNIIAILRSLDSMVDLDKALLSLNEFQQYYNKIVAKLVFYIQTEGESQKIAPTIKKALNDQGLKVVDSIAENVITVNLKASSQYAKVYNNFSVKTSLDISLISGGKTLNGNNVVFVGSSAISDELAFKNSLQNLASTISETGIDKTIGLEK